jgi:WD40 repeat protein/energy-coupling factor transporter ATP-binding protein EcfA2
MVRQYDNYGRDQINIENLQGNATFNQTQIIQIAVAEIKTRSLNTASPYRGLTPFDQNDKDYFFGRDQFLTTLVNELEQTNVVLLLGASGSGKSSVIRAGLIPWLSQKWGSRLINVTLSPDHDPFESLYGSLLKYYKQSDAQMARIGNADTLSHVVQTLKQSQSFWFIFIDQFEELFTTSQPEKRDRFIQSLVKLSQDHVNDPFLKIVATMRADFLDRFDLYPANRLARITEKHRPLITQMHPDELRLAIEQPAAHHGVVFEAELVATIIKDVQGQAGYLPLLQYTLNRLWEEELQTGDIQQERTLHTTTYWRLGGVTGALQKHVDDIYQRLQQEGYGLATQRIFLRLVEIGGDAESGTDWKPVRRRANRSEFKDELEKTVLDELIDEKLVVSDLPSHAQESTVEIAHEILLTCWTALNTWIKENRQAIALRNRLNDDVERWQAKKSDDELWTGSKLEQVLELRDNPIFNQVLGGFSTTANQFIEVSLGKRDRQLRFYRRTAIAGVTAALCITGISIVAVAKWRDADYGQIEALTRSSNATIATNQTAFDALVEALKAGEHFQQASLFGTDASLESEVTEALGQALYLVREQNRLEGHRNYIQRVVFSPDHQRIGTAGHDWVAKLWSPTGKELQTLRGHTDSVNDVAFSPDSKIIGTASSDTTAKLWEPNGKALLTLRGHQDYVRGIRFSPDGTTVVTASDDKTVRLWSIHGKPQGILRGHQGTIYQAIFNHKGTLIATASEDKTVGVWNRKTGKVRFLKGHTQPIIGLSFSPDDHTIATASNDRTVILWNVATGKPNVTLKGHTDGVKDVSFSPNGRTLATASADGTVKLWNLDGTLLDILQGHSGRVNSVSFSKDGRILASSSNDKTARLWQVNRTRLTLLGNHPDSLDRLSISSDGQMIAAASSSSNLVKIWQRNGKLMKSWKETAPVKAIEFSPDGKTVATGSDTTLKLWNLQGKFLKLIWKHPESVLSLSFSPDGKQIATADYGGTMRVWALSGKLLYSLKAHAAEIYSIRFSPDGKWIATASWDQTAKLWNRDKTLLQTLKGHNAPIYSVAFSPTSPTIATASEDNTVKLWNLDGQELRTLKGHTAAIIDVAFSPSGQIATASNDRSIKLWTSQGQLMTTLRGHRNEVNAVGFTADNKSLVSASDDKTVLLWNIESLSLGSLVKQGCEWFRDYLVNHQNVAKEMCKANREK